MGHSATRNGNREADAVFSLFHVNASSSLNVEHRLRKISGVKNATVDFVANSILVRYDPDQITVQDIRELIEKAEAHA
jgi:cation transport ATPase